MNMTAQMILVFILQADTAGWSEAFRYGPTVVLLVLILGFLIRVAPMWKEIRLKEMDQRSEENVVKEKQAEALGQLAVALKDIAVEQRRATEEVGIVLRVNADTSDQLRASLTNMSQRLDRIETTSSHAASES